LDSTIPARVTFGVQFQHALVGVHPRSVCLWRDCICISAIR
jgi:hypothetical protein